MWKNRLAFALLYAVLLVLLILFSKPFLLAALIVLAVSAALMALLTRRDARLLRTSLRVKSGGREGETVPMTFTFAPKRRLLAAQSILVEVESRNDMFGVSVHKHLLFDLADDQQEYTIGVPLVWCGKVTFRCISVQVRDMFGLFSSKAKPFTEICTVVYPHRVRVSTELSSATIGATRNDGVMQNRKGSDASEMFDIRDYVPGDDIRTIHWKLSGKTDELIVRQASDPSHYNIALLPDFGRSHLAGPEAQQELNAAVAIASAIAENESGADQVVEPSGTGGSEQSKPLTVVKNVTAVGFGIAGTVILLLTLLLCAMELTRAFLLWHAERRRRRMSIEERVRQSQKLMFKLISLWGIDAALGWETAATDKALADTLPSVKPGEYERVNGLLEKTIYGGIALEPFEERALDLFVQRLLGRNVKKSWKMRLKLRYACLLAAK